MLMPNGPAAHVGIDLKARAGVHSPASACASGAEGIAVGRPDDPVWPRRRRRGGWRGGLYHADHHRRVRAGSYRVHAQRRPEGASRPFDSDRDGFVLGEGAGAVVLERADRAAARGARMYARLGGYGITSDAYHITGNHPEGIGQIAAMQNAIRMADLSASDIGHVNAHATSTVVGDVG